MISKSQFLCLLLLVCPIYCASRYFDQITEDSSSFKELTQSQLSNSENGVLEWGSTASDINKCTNLSNKYFDKMTYDFTISKEFTRLSYHNFAYITFDAVFLNVAYQTSVNKHGSIDVDGTTQTFEVNVKKDFYNCVTRNGSSSVDGTASIALLFNSKSKNSMKISIKPTDLGSNGRFGIAKMKVYLAKCGRNASFDISTKKCSCNSGYKFNEKVEKKDNNIGIIRSCVNI